MKRDYFTYCPRCRTKLIWKTEHREDPPQQTCEKCGFTFYNNPITATEAIIVHDGKVLMVRRGQQPRKGFLDLPGGFMDRFESPRHGIIREVHEELGCTFTPRKLIGAYNGRYFWKGKDYAVITLSFYGTIKGLPTINNEISKIERVPLTRIPSRLAFAHIRYCLHDLRRYLRKK